MRSAPVRINFLTDHTDTIQIFLRCPSGRALAERIAVVPYSRLLARMTREYWRRSAKQAWWELRGGLRRRLELAQLRDGVVLLRRPGRLAGSRSSLDGGVYVFADVERLSPPAAARATVIWEALASLDRPVRILNHPMRSMKRYELLRTLHEAGINSFDVYRLTEARWPRRYPVFVRVENDHGGPLTPLLHSRTELDDALTRLERAGRGREELLVTEFCDTADEAGLYRKYSAFVVGRQVFAKNLIFSRSWVQKVADLVDGDKISEEREFAETNPHEAMLRRIFELARIEYGRADYGFSGGRMQVWEINTNPQITGAPNRGHRGRDPARDLGERRVALALEDLLRPM